MSKPDSPWTDSILEWSDEIDPDDLEQTASFGSISRWIPHWRPRLNFRLETTATQHSLTNPLPIDFGLLLLVGRALRDAPNNGCDGDHKILAKFSTTKNQSCYVPDFSKKSLCFQRYSPPPPQDQVHLL